MTAGYYTRAVVLDCDRPRQLSLEEFVLPAPAAGDLILKTELADICGADHHASSVICWAACVCPSPSVYSVCSVVDDGYVGRSQND